MFPILLFDDFGVTGYHTPFPQILQLFLIPAKKFFRRTEL